jgi:hypothetical protein
VQETCRECGEPLGAGDHSQCVRNQ